MSFDRVRALARKVFTTGHFARVTAFAIGTGVVVAFIVAGFEQLTVEVVQHQVNEWPLAVLASAPMIGLIVSALILRYLTRDHSAATSDLFIRAYHERHPRLPLVDLPGKLLAGVATIGMGGAVGLEGPSIYTGSVTGLTLHDRLASFMRRGDAQILLTAGAAAGVAAVFKAPATGVLFALEVPYRVDLARRSLLPALLASAASYTTYVALVGSETVVPFLGDPAARLGLGIDDADRTFVFSELAETLERLAEVPVVSLEDLFGATILGVLAGLGGRMFAWLIHRSKTIASRASVWLRVGCAGVILGGLALLADLAFEEPLTLGGGVDAMSWVVDPERTLPLIALLFGMRIAATVVTIGGGGAGGLFIPLASLGVVLGQFVGALLDNHSGLYPTLGLAAFLGAGYRTPIAAVVFVAEATVGGFVVPALVAAAVSQLVAGPTSVSDYQRDERLGHVEHRFTLPLTSILETDVLTVPPDALVSEFVYGHVLGRRERAVPVVDGNEYQGIITLDDIKEIDRADWEQVSVADVMSERDAARPSWTIRDAVATMDLYDADILAVTDQSDTFIGVVAQADIVLLDEILDETGG